MRGLSLKILLFVLLAGCTAMPPAPPQTVNLIVFPGGFNWPVWVAQEKGLFAKHGIDVKVTPNIKVGYIAGVDATNLVVLTSKGPPRQISISAAKDVVPAPH